MSKVCVVVGLFWVVFYKVGELVVWCDVEVIDVLNVVVEFSLCWGFWKCFDWL